MNTTMCNKRKIAFLVLLVVAVSLLVGCGKKENGNPAETSSGAIESAESTTQSTASEPSVSEVLTDEEENEPQEADGSIEDTVTVTEGEWYTSKEEVAAYIHTFGWLPDNFISKKKAEDRGWVSSKGNLWDVAPGMSIGGSRFGNYEGNLPEASGRKYYECDINYEGGYRGAERIVFSNDGLVFYTADHYATFEQLY